MVLLLFACTHGDLAAHERPPRPGGGGGDTGAGPADSDSGPAVDTDEEPLPGDSTPDTGAAPDAPPFFEVDGVQEFALDLPGASMNGLRDDGRTYVLANFGDGTTTLQVGVRLKGNTTWQPVDHKPSWIVDVNHYVEGQSYTGISSFYLHNMMYDPSMMHERLAYEWLRALGTPASRTAYVRLTVNGEDYGLYLAVEKENDEYLAQWFDDRSGSVYEAGSFNWPCDLNYAPGDCYEVDRVGTDDGTTALSDLTTAALAPAKDWLAAIEARVDLDAFLLAMSGDLLVSHYDDYGWNINNYRIYHEPTKDRWYWTPWSTDLAFGWYPWMAGPHCGVYGQDIDEYATGYLIGRCRTNEDCRSRWYAAAAAAADAFQAFDMPARIDGLYDSVKAEMQTDTRRSYSEDEFEAEVACMHTWAEQRPDQVRAQLAE